MPKDGIICTPKEELLTFEEIFRISKIASEIGISKIRITGGEPLVRKGIIDFISKLKSLPKIKEVCITTNGIYLEEYLEDLMAAGLDRVNISLDTMKEDVFKAITINGELKKVLRGIEKSLNKGLKVKLNTVIIPGLNDSEIMDFVKLTEEKPLDVRFIELMPIGEGKKYTSIKSDEIRDIIAQNRKLTPWVVHKNLDGPAAYYKTEKGIGRIGFISAMSHSFCHECNRIRLTSQGFFKQCLFLNSGQDLKKLIRNGITEVELKTIMEDIIMKKPLNHDLIDDNATNDSKFMNEIGG
jgi:cyclic pyranopterin phosphate synthase